MDVVRGRKMLNFIHWVAIHKKEIRSLRDLSREELLVLAGEFENRNISKVKYLNERWVRSFYVLLESNRPWDGFETWRNELKKSGLD